MNQTFDIIYADPPYENSKLYIELLKFFDTKPLTPAQGILFLESPAQLKEMSLTLKHLKPLPVRKYGDSQLHQFIGDIPRQGYQVIRTI